MDRKINKKDVKQMMEEVEETKRDYQAMDQFAAENRLWRKRSLLTLPPKLGTTSY